MGVHEVGFADLASMTPEAGGQDAPMGRFALWPAWAARLVIAFFAALMLAAALTPITVGKGEAAKTPSFTGHGAIRGPQRDEDLALYDRAIARIRHGENYYSFIVGEHRRAHYPVRPGLAVRLPTLAYVDAAIGVNADAKAPLPIALAIALMCGVIAAWWRRLGDEGASESQRLFGTALMFFGASLGLNVYYFVLHELWAGMLLALALGLHRPAKGRWLGAWLAAGAALAIREHALPFVLLMGAMAAWRGNRREAWAWAALVALFLGGMALHLHLIAQQTTPADPSGPSWLACRGLGGWLSNVVLSSNLRFAPHYLAGPAVIAMMLGWAAWNSPAGRTAALLFAGYGLLFMVAGRNDNFYWGAMIAPAMFIGLAFVPMAARGLWRAARG